MTDPSRNARPLVLGLAVLGGLLVLVGAIVSFTNAVPGNLDDAFITLVYARHLAEDGSLYWNAADGAVDGFTSLLDVLIKAVGHGAAEDPLAMARDLSLGTHVLGGIAAMVVVAACGPERGSARAVGAGALTGLALALHPAPAHGASFLLESPLFVVLAVVAAGVPLATELHSSRRARAGWTASLMLLCLVRPEGQALAVILAGLYAVVLAGDASRRVRFGPLLGVVGLLVAVYAWHWIAFGALLPNTFYAKSSGSRVQEIAEGWSYVVAFARGHGALGWLTLALPVLVPMPLLLRGWRHERARARHVLVSTAALASLAMVVVEGGDSYTGGRFVAVPVALSWVAVGHLAACGPSIPRRSAWATVVALALLGTLSQLQAFARGAPGSAISASMDDYACERQAARRLAEIAPEGVVMQTDWQRLKYFEDGLRVIDLHGLNDREIARREVEGPVRYGKFTHAHALEVGAPVWVYGYRLASEQPMAAVPMDALLGDPTVSDLYVGYRAPLEVSGSMGRDYLPASLPVCERYFNVLVRREHADELVELGLLVGDGGGRPWEGAP